MKWIQGDAQIYVVLQLELKHQHQQFVILNLYFETDADNYRKNQSDPLARQQTEDNPQCTAADGQDRE